MDQEDPVKTWDHPIMPLSFPDLDFEQMSMERSHTAPEKSAFRIYYSPPSARRVRLAQLKPGPADGDSVSSSSPWCTPLTSFSLLCLGSSANLSDDMKEMTATWRQAGHGGSQDQRGALGGADVACCGSQTLVKPQMVSVGLQTDGPSRVPPSRSLDGLSGRVERPLARSSSSPKLYRRTAGTLPSSPSSLSPSRGRVLWNPNQQSHASPSLTRQAGTRAASGQNPSSTKPPSKPLGTNRYGLVSEFLRRVSGRVEKPVPEPGQKTKGGVKNLGCAPTRPPSVPLHRSDSVTRIVNQRFMKPREERGGVRKGVSAAEVRRQPTENCSLSVVQQGFRFQTSGVFSLKSFLSLTRIRTTAAAPAAP